MLGLFLLFTVVPVVELMLLIKVGAALGPLPTIGLCLLTGFVGASLARSQGAGVLRRLQATVQSGGLPAREIVDGVLILMAGVVLLTPGFVTDVIGLLLLLPPTRAVVRGLLMQWAERRMIAGSGQRQGASFRFYGGTRGRREAGGQGGPGPEVYTAGNPDQEFLPPGTGPRRPRRAPPRVIEVE